MPIQFTSQTLHSHGSSTQCVARTTLQASELIGAFPLGDERRERVVRLSNEVMQRLLACLEQFEPIAEQVGAGKKEVTGTGLQFNEGRTAVQLPSVVDLRNRCEMFLYAAKGALRDIGSVFDLFHGTTFGHCFQKAREWLEQKYGATDPLFHTFSEDAAWIEQIINMRNAVDHPGTPSVLNVDNFRLVSSKPELVVADPSWRLDDGPRHSIVGDMSILMDNLLTLYEDILVDGLERLVPNGAFTIVEIPETQRDPIKPIRFRVGLRHPIAAHEA